MDIAIEEMFGPGRGATCARVEKAKSGRRFGNAILPLFLALWFCTGCASPGGIQSREQKHAAAYAALSPANKSLVNRGRLAVGMTTNAVYLALGRPDEVLTGVNHDNMFWVYREIVWQHHSSADDAWLPCLMNASDETTEIKGVVGFTDGVVQSWCLRP